jgi:hypothetical protein
MLKFYRIKGDSLYPDYQNGDYVLVMQSPFVLQHLKTGTVVAFTQDQYGLMIKRIAGFSADHQGLDVRGSVTGSIDSRQFGFVSLQHVLGKVIWHIRAPRK